MKFEILGLNLLIAAAFMVSPATAQPVMNHGNSSHGQTASHSHLSVTPIFCNEGDINCYRVNGGFSRIASGPGVHVLTFGWTEDGNSCLAGVLVGGRIDARGLPADSWKMDIQQKEVQSGKYGPVFFRTEVVDRFGNVSVMSDHFETTDPDGTIHASFDGSAFGTTGQRFLSIYVLSGGDVSQRAFTDLVNLNRLAVDGRRPIPNPHTVEDCSSAFIIE